MRIIDSKIRAKIGAVVRANRLAHNMSQDELAGKSGITRMFVYQIENRNLNSRVNPNTFRI